jgi:hypothetical protein
MLKHYSVNFPKASSLTVIRADTALNFNPAASRSLWSKIGEAIKSWLLKLTNPFAQVAVLPLRAAQ